MTDHGAFATDSFFGPPLQELWFEPTFFVLGVFPFLDDLDLDVGAISVTRDDDEERETLLAVIGSF